MQRIILSSPSSFFFFSPLSSWNFVYVFCGVVSFSVSFSVYCFIGVTCKQTSYTFKYFIHTHSTDFWNLLYYFYVLCLWQVHRKINTHKISTYIQFWRTYEEKETGKNVQTKPKMEKHLRPNEVWGWLCFMRQTKRRLGVENLHKRLSHRCHCC